MVTPQEVLDFWFVECEPADWFKKSEEFDHEIRTRFLEICLGMMLRRLLQMH